MKVRYFCSHCHERFDEIELEYLDEEKLGLTSLTPDEREVIIRYDENGRLCLFIICDSCSEHVQGMDVDEMVSYVPSRPILH